MDKTNLAILTNIIGAVESGGQVYGNRRYDAYAGAYANSNQELTCTLGWAQNYGNEGRKLCKMIFEKDPTAFRKADTANIEAKLNVDWVATRWNPTTAQKNALIAIITTDAGKACQDELFEELMTTYEKSAVAYGVDASNVPAIMMWCEIEHLGGLTPVKRIFNRAAKPYTPDTIYASLILDQNDTSNSNQVGDKKFQTRHQCCVKWIKQYVSSSTTTTKTEEVKSTMSEYSKLLSVMEAEVGYLEKASNSNLDSKTGNAGSANYTKYWRDLANWGLGNYQAQYWCAAFVHWCFTTAFGLARAKELLLHAPFIYCPTLANLSKSKGQLYTTPQVGDVVLFYSNGTYGHTGVVYAVNGGYFYTIEGNTSGASGVIANGGGVVKGKKYPISGTSHRFHRPKYSGTVSSTTTTTTTTKNYIEKGDTGAAVKAMQALLIKAGYSCGSAGADGVFGAATETALKKFQQANGLVVDGQYGPASKAQLVKITSKKSIEEVAKEVIAGKWGNGDARKAKLVAAGYNYDEVQKKVNELL